MIGGEELPLKEKKSEWKQNEDGNHNTYYYNTITKKSSWTNPDAYVNNRRRRVYLFVLERPLFMSMGAWRFHRVCCVCFNKMSILVNSERKIFVSHSCSAIVFPSLSFFDLHFSPIKYRIHTLSAFS